MRISAVHFFLPHESNNFRPKSLHFSVLTFYIISFLLIQFTFRIVKINRPDILGFATDIYTEKLLNFTNLKRAEAGLPPLSSSPQLAAAAVAKANDMFMKDYWAHNAPDGATPWVFISGAGYQYLYAGENLARDFSNSEGVVSAWMASPSHKDNILKREYQEVGFAVVNGRLQGEETTLVVQFFGTPQPNVVVNKPVVIPPAAALAPNPSPLALKTSIPEKIAAEKTTPTILSDIHITRTSHYPLFDFFATSKNLATFLTLVLLTVLISDGIFIWRKKIVRVSGHNLAHVIFLGALLGALWVTSQGAIL